MSSLHSAEDFFISGDARRLFLNLELGCGSSCSYCYLPTEGIQTGNRPQTEQRRSVPELLEQLFIDKRFVRGRSGTVLSIGCFSECWDSRTRPETIRLIQNLLPFDNWLQFATKRQITSSDLDAIVLSPYWRRQVVAYISTATISQWNSLERGTSPPVRRFKSFSACVAKDLRACLYVKPVLPGVTLQDVNSYGDIMKKYGVDAVVGELFIADSTPVPAPISTKLHVAEHPEVIVIRDTLKQFGRVFDSSIQHLLTA